MGRNSLTLRSGGSGVGRLGPWEIGAATTSLTSLQTALDVAGAGRLVRMSASRNSSRYQVTADGVVRHWGGCGTANQKRPDLQFWLQLSGLSLGWGEAVVPEEDEYPNLGLGFVTGLKLEYRATTAAATDFRWYVERLVTGPLGTTSTPPAGRGTFTTANTDLQDAFNFLGHGKIHSLRARHADPAKVRLTLDGVVIHHAAGPNVCCLDDQFPDFTGTATDFLWYTAGGDAGWRSVAAGGLRYLGLNFAHSAKLELAANAAGGNPEIEWVGEFFTE